MKKQHKNPYKTRDYFQLKRLVILFDCIKLRGLDKNFRKKFKIKTPTKGQNFTTANPRIFKDTKNKKLYDRELSLLVKEIKSKIPEKWWTGSKDLKKEVEWWLWTNVPSFESKALPFGIKTAPGKDSRLFIEVYPYTRLEDIKKHWQKIIRPKQLKLRGYSEYDRDPWPNYQRDKKIYELKKAGKSDRKIYGAMYDDNPDLDIGNIKRIVSEFKKNTKIS